MSRMAERNRNRRMPAFLSLLALMLLTLLDSSAAVTEKKVPSRTFRMRARSSDRSHVPQSAGMRTVRRFQGSRSNPGESARRVNYAPLRPIVPNDENKLRASESVHVVSLHSMNHQGKSQPVYRAAVTKLKIPEDDYLMEPKEVSVRVVSSQSVVVTWEDPQYEKSGKVGSNRHYTIRYREKGESARWDYKKISTRRALVDKLNPDAMYEFSVRISQEDQEGQWSSSVFQRTPESAPISAPENLYVEPLKGKGTAVTATWDELSDSAGKIKEYIISYAPAMKPFGGKSLSYSGTTLSAVIDGLQPGERYIFKIRAANRRGQGPQSKAITVTMPVASAATKNVYHQSQLEDFENVEKTKQKKVPEKNVPSESFEEDSLDNVEDTLSHTQVDKIWIPSRKTANSETNPQSTEVTDDAETTTLTPKLPTPSPRRRVHPLLNNRFSPNIDRRPLKTSSLNLRRKLVASRPAPTMKVTDGTKDSEFHELDIHSTMENKHKSKDDEITNESKEVLNNSDNLENVASKVSQTDLITRESSTKMNVHKVDGPHKVENDKSLPTSPLSDPLVKRTTSLNKRKDTSKTSIMTGVTKSSNLEKLPTNHKPHFAQIPSPNVDEDKDISESDESRSSPAVQSPRSTNNRNPIVTIPKQTPSSKVDRKQSHSTLLLNKESTHFTHNYTISDPTTNKGDSQNFQTKTFKGPNSLKISNTKSRQQTIARAALRTLSSTTIPPTSTTTTTTTATTTAATTTATTTTTEVQTTSKSYKQNIMDIDNKVSPSTKQPTVPSFSGKSALDILQYYRRRSSQVSSNVGRKITSNGNSKSGPLATTQTTTSTASILITMPPKIVRTFNDNKLLQAPIKKEDSYLSSSEVPSKSSKSRQEMYMKESKEEFPPITSVTHKSKKEKQKTSSTAVNIPVKKDNTGTKYKQLKVSTSKESQIPSVASRLHNEKSRHSDEEHEEQTEERKITPILYKNPKSNLVVSSKPTSASRISSAVPIPQLKSSYSQTRHTGESSPSYVPENRNAGLKKTLVEQGYDSLTPLSGDPFIQPDSSDIEEDHASQHQTKTSDRESFPLSRTVHSSRQRPSYRTNGRISPEGERRIGKPFVSSSRAVAPIKHIPTIPEKSEFSTLDTSDIHSIPENQPLPEKVENPTSPLKKRLSSYSNVRLLKNRNNNGNIIDNKNSLDTTFSQKQSIKLEDEDGLIAPPTLKENNEKSSGASSSLINSKQSVIPRRSTTTVSPTSRPQSPTRVSPYRLLPSKSRQLNYGRSTFHRTTPSPTTSQVRTVSPTYSSSLLRQRMLNSRLGSPLRRQFARPSYRQGNNGRPNLPSHFNTNGNTPSTSNGRLNGQRMIYGPEGTKWVVDLNRGLVLNPEGRYLQDSQGKPLRIKLGGDGRTIVDLNGTPVVSPDGLPLFGHGRFSKPVASPQDRPVLSLGGRPLRGLEVARTTKPPTTKITTTRPTTTTLPPTTTTTTPEPTTVEPTTEEPLLPTCPPGSNSQYDEEGNMIMGPDDKPECYTEDSYSGEDLIVATAAPESVTFPDLDQDYDLLETTQHPIQTTATTTDHPILTGESEIKSFDNNLVSEFDASGKKRFSAPYVSYISKDPNTPCSLNDALEHFQVETLADLIPNEMKDEVLPPQKISYNITVVAVEGCHSFVILDWAKPKKGDYITGYLVYSASYDDFLRNKWSTGTAGGTNFPIENLKPNTRYYFKIQAKNPHGFGPVSPSVSYVTESDNPLLIVRPPGGEPIWIPFAFKHDASYTGCHGKQYVKRTWYRKFVGVVLCNSLRYKIYLSENLRDTFYSIGDSWGRGEDHCQFVDSYMEGRTDPLSEFQILPVINGYYRQYTQEPVMFGQIGYGTPHNYVGWYECGVPIPGKW